MVKGKQPTKLANASAKWLALAKRLEGYANNPDFAALEEREQFVADAREAAKAIRSEWEY